MNTSNTLGMKTESGGEGEAKTGTEQQQNAIGLHLNKLYYSAVLLSFTDSIIQSRVTQESQLERCLNLWQIVLIGVWWVRIPPTMSSIIPRQVPLGCIRKPVEHEPGNKSISTLLYDFFFSSWLTWKCHLSFLSCFWSECFITAIGNSNNGIHTLTCSPKLQRKSICNWFVKKADQLYIQTVLLWSCYCHIFGSYEKVTTVSVD